VGWGSGQLAAKWRRSGGPRRTLELGAPDTSGVRSGGGSPGTTAPGHARGRLGKREKGESGWAGWWAGPRRGAQLQFK
jgi:hypothetical protein